MKIAVLGRDNRVTNVLGLALGVDPGKLKRVDNWRMAPEHPITPGWRYDDVTGRFLPPRPA